MVNLQADATLSVAAAGLTSGLPYVLPWFLDTGSQNLNSADLNVIGTAMRADVQLDTVATLTAAAIRNAMVDSTLAVTATLPTDVGRVAIVDAALGITASSFESAPVAYDATGTGANCGAGAVTSLTWTHTATAGADVFAFVLRGAQNITVTHDGVAMTYVGAISLNNDAGNGTLYIFRRAAVPGGTKTIVATFSSATNCSANSVSYLNVGTIKLASTYAGTALTASHTISGADKSIIVSALGQYCGGVDTFVSASGGTLRSQQMGSVNTFNLVIQDSTSTGSVTFSSTVTATATVSGGVGMILSPPPPTSTHVKTVELLSTVSTGAQPNAYSINWNHTIESDATLLVVAWGGLSTQFYTSVTVNGQAMTKVGDWAWVVNGFVGWINYHVYLMPPSGVQNIVISGGGTGAYMSATSLTFRNAKAVGAMIYGTNGVVSGQGPNDFLLNVVSGWVNGQAGFTGYNQNLIFADLSTTGEPALFGYARGSAATFNISNLLANYGGWGNAILPIKPMIDAQGDSPLAVTATISSAGVLARQADAPLALTASIPAISIRTAQIDAAQTVTTSVSGAIVVDLHGNATMPTTAAPTGGALRNANVDAAQIITASRTSNVTWTTTANVAQVITAGRTSVGSYGAVAASTLPVTTTLSALITWQLKANVAQTVTATITGTGLRNANVDAPLVITASRTANVTWALIANVAQTITATIQAAEQRMVNVDATQTIAASAISPDTPAWDSTGAGYTSGYGSGSWSHTLVNASMIVVGIMCNATSGATANIDGTINIPQIGSAAPVGGSGQYLFIFALAQPPQGAHTINVANASGYLVGSSVAYRNVWGVSPLLQTNSGSGTSETQTVNATSNVWVFQMFGAFGNQAQSAYNQTARYYGWGGATYPMMFGDAPGATTVSFSATMNNVAWGAAAMLLLPGTNVYAGRTAQSAQTATATPSGQVKWTTTGAATQQITASPTGTGSRGQGLNVTQPITATPSAIGSRGQTVNSTQTVTATDTAVGSRGQFVDSTQIITASPSGLINWQALAYVDLSLTAATTGKVIWAFKANAAQIVTANRTALVSYGATGNVALPITASRTADSIWNTTGGAALVITAGPSAIGSRGQLFDSAQIITALPIGVGSRGQFVDSTLELTTTTTGLISYGATGNALLVITASPTDVHPLLDNHAYADLLVTATRPANVIWDTRADSRLTITAHSWAAFGRLLNVDANLAITAKLPVWLKSTLFSNVNLGITAGLPTRFSRGQVSDSAQAIVVTPAGGIVWHGRIAAPLRITAGLLADSTWDAHADSRLTVTESGLVVASHGQDIDPALVIAAEPTGEFTQTMTGDVEQAIAALPDTELSLGSTMDSALPLIVTYSATLSDAVRGGNFFYFYL